MRGIVVGLAAVLAVASVPAIAQQIVRINGNDLFRWCESSVSAENAMCMAYIMGAIDGESWMRTSVNFWNKEKGETQWVEPCYRHTVTNRQLMDIVTKYLVDNPAERDQPAATLVSVAFWNVFRCPTTPTQSD